MQLKHLIGAVLVSLGIWFLCFVIGDSIGQAIEALTH